MGYLNMIKKSLNVLLVIVVASVNLSKAQWDEFPVHPSYELVNLKATGFNAKAGAMAWLSDGRMVYVDYGKTNRDGNPGTGIPKYGKVIILDNLESEDPDQIARKEVATGLWMPLGVVVLNNKIYVAEVDKIRVYEETTPGSFIERPSEALSGWAVDAGIWGQWSMGLIYTNDAFYLNQSVGWDGGANPNASSSRASVVKVTLDNEFSVVASGFRSHNGIGVGPGGDIFITENNGTFVPTEYLAHLKQGHYYGFEGGAPNLWEYSNGPYQRPAVYIPHWEMGASPSSPHLLKSGIFRGQLLATDYRWGQIGRYFLEKVDGEWQGAVYRFSGGFEAGPHRILLSPDESEIYVGGIGAGDNLTTPLDATLDPSCGNWCWRNTQYGFQKLKKKSPEVIAFEILSTRSRNNGIEIEFTKPVNTNGVNKSSFIVTRQWGYSPGPGYGQGQKTDNEELQFIDFEFSSDNKKVFLEFSNLKEERLIHIRIGSSLVSSTGESLLSPDSYYTLNNISESKKFDINGCTDPSYEEYSPDATFDDGSCLTERVGLLFHSLGQKQINSKIDRNGMLSVSAPLEGFVLFQISDLTGKVIASKEGVGTEWVTVQIPIKHNGLLFIRAFNADRSITKTIVLK